MPAELTPHAITFSCVALQLMRTGDIMRKGSFKHRDLVLIVVNTLFVCLSQCQPVLLLLLLFWGLPVLFDPVCLSLNLKFRYWLSVCLSLLLYTLLLFERFALLLPLLTYCASDSGLHLLFLLPLFVITVLV